MNARCYILFSKKLNKFYTGVTQTDINERLRKHNQHNYGKHRFTAQTNDWEVFLEIVTENYAHAVRIERKIKAMKSRKYIQNLKLYPDMLERILKQSSN